jgi:hypothetical protein
MKTDKDSIKVELKIKTTFLKPNLINSQSKKIRFNSNAIPMIRFLKDFQSKINP